MMRGNGKKAMVILGATALAGLFTSPIEGNLHQQFLNDGLISRPLAINDREKIGQTLSVLSLGGLRSVVASFINLRAYASFQDSDWVKIEKEFETMVMLQPKVAYYWEAGAWHLSYNAATSSMENENLPEVRRRVLHKEYVAKGKAFLERGVQSNPGHVNLLSTLGMFHSNAAKYPDYSKAADAYRAAFETGKARGFHARAWLYCLARVEGRKGEALAMARLYYENPANRVDSLVCLLFALESGMANPLPAEKLLRDLFPSFEEAQKMLTLYARNKQNNMPQDGVDYALEFLKSQVGLEPPKLLRK